MRHRFLSPDWIDAVRAIRDEFQPLVDDALASGTLPDGLVAEGSAAEAAAQTVLAGDIPALDVNLNVTAMPDGADDVAAHATTADGSVELELGHLSDADLVVTVEHDVLRAMVVDQDPQAAMMAFMSGKIAVDGDLTVLLGEGSNPLALLQSLDLTGGGLAAVDPTLAAVGERIKAITE